MSKSTYNTIQPATITKQGKTRLKKLIKFMRGLRPEQFNFTIWRCEDYSCGTTACAWGWTPNVFPRLIKAGFHGMPKVVGFNHSEWRHITDIQFFFDIDEETESALFYPAEDVISGNATPAEWVAGATKILNSLEVIG